MRVQDAIINPLAALSAQFGCFADKMPPNDRTLAVDKAKSRLPGGVIYCAFKSIHSISHYERRST